MVEAVRWVAAGRVEGVCDTCRVGAATVAGTVFERESCVGVPLGRPDRGGWNPAWCKSDACPLVEDKAEVGE